MLDILAIAFLLITVTFPLSVFIICRWGFEKAGDHKVYGTQREDRDDRS